MNFPDAVIYRLKCYNTKTYYIGSTVNLKLRMRKHRSKKYNHTNSKSIIEGGNYGEPKILFEYPCNNKKELQELEQCFLDTYREKYGDSVLNIYDAYTTEEKTKEKKREYNAKYRADNPDKVKESSASWRKNNPEKKKENDAKYRAENREILRAKTNEKFDCVCGGSYTRANKSKHFSSKTHQKFIQIQNQNQIQKQVS